MKPVLTRSNNLRDQLIKKVIMYDISLIKKDFYQIRILWSLNWVYACKKMKKKTNTEVSGHVPQK